MCLQKVCSTLSVPKNYKFLEINSNVLLFNYYMFFIQTSTLTFDIILTMF